MTATRGDAADAAGEPSLEDEALLLIGVAGSGGAGEVAAACGVAAEAAHAAVDALVAAGDLERRRGERVALTARGRGRAEAVLAGERRALGDAVHAIDRVFSRLDARMKAAVTRWQVRRTGSVEVPNDHRDRRYDAAVLAEIAELAAAAEEALRPLAALRSRFARVGPRLTRAIERARAGDGAAVSGLEPASVHSLWWRLHAEILALLGRARGGSQA